MAKYFGTDGIRGKANELLTAELALKLGQAASLLTQDSGTKQLLIGKDTRVSGDMLETALAAGLMSAGVDVFLLGVIPTPGVAALCRTHGAPGAVISASHNPYYDNGIKFFSAAGLKLPDAVQAAIEEQLERPENLLSPEMGRLRPVPGASRQYMDFLLDAQHPDLTGVKLVVDCANGAASAIAGELLRMLGAQVIELASQPDGCNINEGCGSTHPERLQQAVVEHGAICGLALDGDADRLIAVDEQGALVDGDMLLTLFSRHMRKRGSLANNSVVVSQMCNMALRLKMMEQGITVAESKVGDRYVLEKMRECGACLGGEQSGHLILSDYNNTGDALAASLYLLGMIQAEAKSLSELTAGIHPYPQVHMNVTVKNKDNFAEDAEIGEAIARAEQELAGQGRVVARVSGTEPYVRVMTEGPDEEQLKRLTENIAETISRKLG